MYKVLDRYKSPSDIKLMSSKELQDLSEDIREFLIHSISKTGGHLASNLGVVELTISLYKVFNMEEDKVIWDVGHQSYVHKILTGRKDQFNSLRKFNGLSGFPKRCESKYDCFETGHSSTSISAGLGIARARDIKKEDFNVISIIGDGALTGGMALEALNDLGFNKTKMIIILNDNQMSISQNVGGLSSYLSKLRVDPGYRKIKNDFNNTLEKVIFGKNIVSSLNKIKDGIKQMIMPGMIFEEMGIKYLGPIDGHNIKEVSEVLSAAKDIDGPVIIHTLTQKGKGYEVAEDNPNKYHGVGPFNYESGEILGKSSGKTYSSAFGEEMISLAEKDDRVVAITAAMPDGTGLKNFSKIYKNRFFDVGIAEQHGATLAAGLASEGMKPVFAVYSTFLQRAYDQVIHDVCIQNLPVVFAIDRAGIVGEDGETHQGIFDISYLNLVPNITIIAPKCVEELKVMLRWAIDYNKGPVAIRYPRGGDLKDIDICSMKTICKGKWEIIDEGEKVAIIATGKMVQHAIKVKEILKNKGLNPKIINASFIKPLDYSIIEELVGENYNIITVEDNVITGGLGESILSYVNEINGKVNIKNLGFNDNFVPHGDLDNLYSMSNLHPEGIAEEILKTIG
ncbi:1-deoxy-D-xylulose-5-phosphate synthase [Clostridium hydrogeniformans]|uniref:1-deoxy-D-xylulose-5-phosphate synthase n=1 Tax=Clostridium hydrogeniformans TaxID=349933 RepID=UPI000483C039|nr:1-deoxy-D-xylulose-5-phosphate synthase [Clostridium hydrogeniformans]